MDTLTYVNPTLSPSEIIDFYEPIDTNLSIWFSDVFRYANKFNVYPILGKKTYENGTLKQYTIDFSYYNLGCPFKLYVKEIVDGKDKYPLEKGDVIISDTLKYTVEMSPTEDNCTIYGYMQIGDTLKCHSLCEQSYYVLNRICTRIIHLIDCLQCYNNDKYQVFAPDISVTDYIDLEDRMGIYERRYT